MCEKLENHFAKFSFDPVKEKLLHLSHKIQTIEQQIREELHEINEILLEFVDLKWYHQQTEEEEA
jgi:cell division protein FtsL